MYICDDLFIDNWPICDMGELYNVPVDAGDVVFLKIEDIDNINVDTITLINQCFTLVYYNDTKGIRHIHYYIPLMILFARILKIPDENDIVIYLPICLDVRSGVISLYCYSPEYSCTQTLCFGKNKHFSEEYSFEYLLKNICDIDDHHHFATHKDQFTLNFSKDYCRFLVIYLPNDDEAIISSVKIDDQEYSFFIIEWMDKILYIISFVKNEFGEFVSDLEDLHEIFTRGVFEYKHIPHKKINVDVSTISVNKVLKYCAFC